MTSTPAEEPDDVTTALQMMDGDEAGLRALLQKYGSKVRGWLRKKYAEVLDHAELEDVFSEAVHRAWVRASQFDEKRGSLRVWFMIIAKNAAIDALRRIEREPTTSFDDLSPEEQPWSKDNPDDELTPKVKKLARALDEILARLSPQQREVIAADMAAEGLADTADSQRLAERLGLPVANIYVARSKARKTIREELKRRGLDPTEGITDERQR